MNMKLVIAIIQNEDNQKLNNALVKEGFRSTRLATSGGFLRTGNTTVMIGVEAVSYPHLDVYKRQVCLLLTGICTAIIIKMLNAKRMF